MKNRVHRLVFVTLLASTLFTGCLKSRVQLAKDEDADAPMPAQVTDVRTPEHSAALDEMRAEINRLNSKVDDLERTNKDLTTDMSKQNKTKSSETIALEERIHEMEQAQAALIEEMKKKQKEAAAKPDSGASLKKAQQLYDEKSYAEAVELLNDYLKNPKNPKIEDATYLRGDAYFGLKQYKKSILDYNTVTEKFPKSKRIPSALSKIAKSFEKLGMKSDAKVFYQELKTKFPNSPEAKKAP